MSAERHALDAALEYSGQLERQLKAQDDEIDSVRLQNNELRRQLEAVKSAARDRSEPECNQASTPMAMQARPIMSDRPCCKNCGCPI